MNLSKENRLALKISIILGIFSFILFSNISLYNHYMMGNYSNNGMGGMMGNGNGGGFGNSGFNNYKYYFVIFLSIFIYFISYTLAKITIKPIEENNDNLKKYNHNLAHELKTPISIIKNNLELFELSPDKDLIKSSFEEVDNMQKIIDRLLIISEKNTLKNIEKINLENIFKKYLNEEIDLKIEGKFEISGDKILINQMISNLINNAKKYNIGDEKIKIIIKNNEFLISNKTDLDNNFDKNKLFEEFYQADNSRSQNGYGLGLSIVKKIASLHSLKINISIKGGYFIVSVKK